MYKFPLLHARNCARMNVGREAPFTLHFENTGILRLTIMSDACERTASSGGADGGNVRRSRLLCSILVFKVATRTDLMYTIYLYLLPLFMIRRLPYEVCELKYMVLLLLNVYVEQDNN